MSLLLLFGDSGSATVAAPTATATADAIAPSITTTVSISAPQATATAASDAPAIQTNSTTTVQATQAAATGDAFTPTISTTIAVPAPAAATADANTPTLKITVVEPMATATASGNIAVTVRTIAAPQAAATATANTPFITASCIPFVNDVITSTGAGVTTISLDMSTLDVPDRYSKVIVELLVKTTTSIAFPTVSGSASVTDWFEWTEAHGPSQVQILMGQLFAVAPMTGTLTFSWTGAHDALMVAYCISANGCQVYLENTQGGTSGDANFDALSFPLDGGDQLVLLTAGTNAATLSTVSAPSGFPDNTYGPYTANSSITLLAIDNLAGTVLSYNPGNWTLSDDTVQSTVQGVMLGFSAYPPPANNDLADATDFGGTGSGSSTGTYTGSWLEDLTEADDASWWQGTTSWWTFVGRGGGWTIEVDGSLVAYTSLIGAYAGAYFALYEASVGETDPSTIYAGYVNPDSDTWFGGADDDLNYTATFNALDATKQYWVQVDSTYYPVTHADYTISWTQVPTTVLAPMATATAAANTPSISSGSGLSVAAPQSTATAAALIPTITATSNVTLVVPLATALAMAFGESGVSGGDGLVIGGGTGDDGMTARWVIDLAASDG